MIYDFNSFMFNMISDISIIFFKNKNCFLFVIIVILILHFFFVEAGYFGFQNDEKSVKRNNVLSDRTFFLTELYL